MDAETFYKSINKFGRRKGFDRDEANDFASYSVISFLQGRKATFTHYFIDYLRHRFGNKRSSLFEVQKKIKNPDYEYIDTILGSEADLDTKIDIKKALECLTLEERYLIYLKFYCAYSTSEIAIFLGVCRKTVWGYLRKVIIKIRQSY